MDNSQKEHDETIVFYYRKRAITVTKEILEKGYLTLGGHDIKLTDFIDKMFDKLPEQQPWFDDPNFDENVPYILCHKDNSIIKNELGK